MSAWAANPNPNCSGTVLPPSPRRVDDRSATAQPAGSVTCRTIEGDGYRLTLTSRSTATREVANCRVRSYPVGQVVGAMQLFAATIAAS